MSSRPRTPIGSPLKNGNGIEASRSPLGSQKIKENGSQSPLIEKGSQKRPRDSEDTKYNLRSLKVPDFSENGGLLSPNVRSPQRSPRRSPRNENKENFKFQAGENQELVQEIEFEEGMRVFESPNDRLKAFWMLPFKKLQAIPKKDIKLTSDLFPINGKKQWRFLAEIEKDNFKLTKFYVGIECILNEKEQQNPDWKREVHLDFRVTLKRGNFDVSKGFNRSFSNKCKDSGFLHQEKALVEINLSANDCFIIECAMRDNKSVKNNSSEFLGLVNAGNTCYMNSFLQTLYHLSCFARIVYKVPFSVEKSEAISAALQKLFYSLKYGKKPVPTTELIRSFGWDKKQAWVQQDVQEFCCLLLDALDAKMKGMDHVDGAIKGLFEGQVLNYVKCINVDYESTRYEKFQEVQLMVKGMTNIYDSLDYYVSEELLEGENKYDADIYGKQEAKKGMRFSILPPVLMLYLKRFEYDYEKDKNIKKYQITDRFEYYDEIDMAKYVVEGYQQTTKYKLFSVLVHSGVGAASGHYYAFIRPKSSDARWYKFNDDIVDFAEPEEVFEANFGGTHTEAKLNQAKEIETSEAVNQSSAYMLVYLREDQVDDLLRPIDNDEVPAKLIEEIEKNKRNDEDRRKKGEEFFKLYITSYDLIQDLTTPGITFYKMGAKDEDYADRFLRNKSKRLKVYFKKNSKVLDLLKFISDNTGIPQQEIMIWKITIAKEQMSQVLKKNFLNSTGPNLTVLGNGVNSNQTKSIFFVHTLNKTKYPAIFQPKEKYASSFNDVVCKNALEFAQYPVEMEIEPKTQNSDSDKDSTKVENLLDGASQTYLDLLDEKYLIVFMKIYSFTEGNPAVRMHDYFLIQKTLKFKDLREAMKERYPEMNIAEANLYKEDRKKYTLEKVTDEDKLDDESADSGVVCVVEFKDDSSSNRMDYISAVQYYEQLAQRVWVHFIPGKHSLNTLKTIMDGKIPYHQIVDFVSKTIFENEVPANKVLLRAKWKNSSQFTPVPCNNKPELKLADLVKSDERVYCEVSKIEVDQLDKKLKCLIYYYSNVSNTRTNEEEIFVDKTATIQQLISEIEKKNYFLTERSYDMEIINKPANLRVMLLEKKKEKLVGRALNDQTVSSYTSKYRLRVEYVLTEFEDDKAEESQRYYPIYCFHTTREGEIFSNPFLFFSRRSVGTSEFRQRLYDHIKDWDIWADKKVTINEEYFLKIRMIMKSDISDTKSVKIENEEIFPFQELDKEAKKYFLEIIHPFNITSYQQMKIQI